MVVYMSSQLAPMQAYFARVAALRGRERQDGVPATPPVLTPSEVRAQYFRRAASEQCAVGSSSGSVNPSAGAGASTALPAPAPASARAQPNQVDAEVGGAILTNFKRMNNNVAGPGSEGSAQRKRPRYDNSGRARLAAQRKASAGTTSHREMALDPDRLPSLCASDCECSRLSCFKQYVGETFMQLKHFVSEFHLMAKNLQDGFLHMCFPTPEAASSIKLVGFSVSRSCMCKLLGIGGHRLQRILQGEQDMRYRSTLGSVGKPCPKTLAVDAFCLDLWLRVGEVLPTCKASRAATWRAICNDSSDDESNREPLTSVGPELQEQALTAQLGLVSDPCAFVKYICTAAGNDVRQLSKRHLEAGNITDLYSEFCAVQADNEGQVARPEDIVVCSMRDRKQ